MDKKTFERAKYCMVLCPCSNGVGHIQNPRGQCWPRCGGFGFVKSELEEDTSPIVGKEEESPMKEGEIFESLLDGAEYVVKSIVNKMVVLQSRKRDKQIITGIETLKTKSLYRKKESEIEQ